MMELGEIKMKKTMRSIFDFAFLRKHDFKYRLCRRKSANRTTDRSCVLFF